MTSKKRLEIKLKKSRKEDIGLFISRIISILFLSVMLHFIFTEGFTDKSDGKIIFHFISSFIFINIYYLSFNIYDIIFPRLKLVINQKGISKFYSNRHYFYSWEDIDRKEVIYIQLKSKEVLLKQFKWTDRIKVKIMSYFKRQKINEVEIRLNALIIPNNIPNKEEFKIQFEAIKNNFIHEKNNPYHF